MKTMLAIATIVVAIIAIILMTQMNTKPTRHCAQHLKSQCVRWEKTK